MSVADREKNVLKMIAIKKYFLSHLHNSVEELENLQKFLS